jgi:tetratricopeptide (TPR) repeat protein
MMEMKESAMSNKRIWLPSLVTCLIVGVAVPLLCQLAPAVRVLTHEFTQLFTMVSFVAIVFAAWKQTKKAKACAEEWPEALVLQDSFTVSLAGLLLCGWTAFAVMAAFNVWGPRCQFTGGASFFWITWTPAALFGAVLGCIAGCRRWQWWKTLLLLLVIFILSFVQDGLQAWRGVRVADFIVGEPVALDQRAGIEASSFHIHQRLFVLLLTAALWQWEVWRACRNQKDGKGALSTRVSDRRLNVLWALLVAVVIVAGSHVGIGWGRGAMLSYLSAERETEHFVIHYPPSGDAANKIDEIGDYAEWCWDALCRRWEITPHKKVALYCFNNYGDLQKHTGAGAHAVVRSVFLSSGEATGDTMLHELIHALHIELKPRWTTIFNRGVEEGVAEAFAAYYADLPEAHQREAGALKHNRLPSAAQFMDLLGFWTIREGNAYSAAGSFIGFLVRQYGMDKFRVFTSTLDYEKAYGCGLGDLDKAWRAFLSSIPVDLETQLRAAESYDASLWGESYLDCNCPKLGDTVEKPETRARNLWFAGNYRAARAVYEELFKRDGKPRWAGQTAQCLYKLGREEEAAALLEQQLARTGLTDFDRVPALKTLVNCLMSLKAWDKLYPRLDEQTALEKDAEALKDRNAVGACLHNPDLRDAVAGALLTEDPNRRCRQFKELADRFPQDASLRRLYLTRGISADMPRAVREMKARVAEMLDTVKAEPSALKTLSQPLSAAADRLMDNDEYEFARGILDIISGEGVEAMQRARIERKKGYLAFVEARKQPVEQGK